MANLSEYWEGVDSVSPSEIHVSPREAGCTRPYYLIGVGAQTDITDAFKQILGYPNVAITGDQKINRSLPLSDPQVQVWTAKRIVGMRGLGEFVKTDVSTFVTGGPDPMPSYALYDNYEFTIEFGQEPYAVLQDYMIDVPTPPPDGPSPGFWFDLDPNNGAQNTIPYLYANEWTRYTDFDLIPQNDYVTGVKGESYFVTGDDSLPGGSRNARHQGKTFTGMPRVFLPNQILRMTWREVPLRFYTSTKSFLKKYRGRVNQFDWYDNGAGGKLFPAGSLLYMNCTPKIYTSPILSFQAWGNGDLTPPKVCDFELTFLTTDRILSGVAPTYATGQNTDRIPNRNFIPAGFNLQPWFDKGQSFYYCVFNSGTTQTPQNIPYFLSFPVSLLFTDPDAPQPGG